jgi:hypothetical protein
MLKRFIRKRPRLEFFIDWTTIQYIILVSIVFFIGGAAVTVGLYGFILFEAIGIILSIT